VRAVCLFSQELLILTLECFSGTAIAAFYVPVTVMIILYWGIWRETEKRKKDLPNLQAAGKKECSKRSNSSDEAMDLEDWKRTRSESSTGPDEVDSASFVSVSYRTVKQLLILFCPYLQISNCTDIFSFKRVFIDNSECDFQSSVLSIRNFEFPFIVQIECFLYLLSSNQNLTFS